MFKPGDKVRLRGPARMLMTVKSVSAAGVLCEWSNAIKRGALTVAPESLEQIAMQVTEPQIYQTQA
jgi:uncharacterized protein YodC (DUF2158 family)